MAILVVKARYKALGHERADLFPWKIDNAHDESIDEIIN